MRWSTLLSLAAVASAIPTEIPTIHRDVLILGGGATGTYAAVQLRSQGHSVALVEQKPQLGGHAETLYLPDGEHINYGVEGYFNNDITKDFFAQLDLDYELLLPGSILSSNVNFETGEVVLPGSGLLGTVAGALLYRAAIEEFHYLSTGAYNLPDEIPEVLLRPFREFVEKHALQGALGVIFTFAENLGDLLDRPLLYVIQNFGIPQIDALVSGGYIRPKNGTGELFAKAATCIDPLNIFYSSAAVDVSRNETGVQVTVRNHESGKEMVVQAKKLLIAFPPTLPSLQAQGFDLAEEETALFSKWNYMSYYAATITNTGLPDGLNVANTNPENQPGSLPEPPFIWELEYSGVSGYFLVKIVAHDNFTAADAKDLIFESLKSMRESGSYQTTPEDMVIAAFADHSPETLTVDVEDIRGGFYKRLYGLQGERSTFYTGYTFCMDYSTVLWEYTAGVVGMMGL